jgi:hypothetical protein
MPATLAPSTWLRDDSRAVKARYWVALRPVTASFTLELAIRLALKLPKSELSLGYPGLGIARPGVVG